jgi:hypothetical protein
MKITKKLAKEIFQGNFKNINWDQLQIDKIGNDNRKYSVNCFPPRVEFVEALYHRPEFITDKEFDKLTGMRIVYLPGKSKNLKGKKFYEYTDVLSMRKAVDGHYYLQIERCKSERFYAVCNFDFDINTRAVLLERMVKSEDRFGF